MSDTLAYKRAKRGEAFLDEKLPGWFLDIDVEKLDLSSGCSCVLGQLATDIVPRRTWFKRWARTGAKPEYSDARDQLKLTNRQTETLGFMSEYRRHVGPLVSMEELTEAWKRIIAFRQRNRWSSR